MLLREATITFCIYDVTTVQLLDIHIQAYNVAISWHMVYALLKRSNLYVRGICSYFQSLHVAHCSSP